MAKVELFCTVCGEYPPCSCDVEVRSVRKGGLVVEQGDQSVWLPREWHAALLDALLQERGMEAVSKEWMERYRNAYQIQEIRAGRGERPPVQREEPE